ncbi:MULTISPECIES: DUF4247 domain-containing protein [Paenibacillus]|uniref:DUF4247 domain-containing protein n=1 Tax=Paenibacillus TaxID=44249 RepID=UPI00043155E2|nr:MULTISPECIES: DUF4247 domain-containing protein [Paenibacillus]CDN41714.1 Putative uncharacterized protein [Paenibacillus sp. P22]
MGKKWLNALKWVLAATLVVSLLSGCGAPRVSDQYPLVSVSKEGGQTSYVYRAAGETVPEVAARLAEQKKPQQMSDSDDERMFLVYSDQWYHLQRDPAEPRDTLIEIDNKEFIQRNYNPSFLEGYLTAVLVGQLFDTIGSYGKYRGYTGRDVYKPATGSYRTPTVSDKKMAPPLTVPGKGFITKRGGKVTDRPSDSGGLFDRNPTTSSGSKGTIKRGSGSSSDSSGSWLSPRKSVPKTKFGSSGKIRRRR